MLVGFVMISDNIAPEFTEYVGPYFLWRLLVDARWQHRGDGRAAVDLTVAHVRTRPNAERLMTSAVTGDGFPLDFYLRYGFVLTGDVDENGEVILEPPCSRSDPTSGTGLVRWWW